VVPQVHNRNCLIAVESNGGDLDPSLIGRVPLLKLLPRISRRDSRRTLLENCCQFFLRNERVPLRKTQLRLQKPSSGVQSQIIFDGWAQHAFGLVIQWHKTEVVSRSPTAKDQRGGRWENAGVNLVRLVILLGVQWSLAMASTDAAEEHDSEIGDELSYIP
jgi:hypothetical protein